MLACMLPAPTLAVPDYHAEPAPFAAILTQFEDTMDSGDWPRAWELFEPIPASESDLAILKVQVAFHAGHVDDSLSLIRMKDLSSSYPSEVWRLETLHASTSSGRDYQILLGPHAYAENQASR